MMFNYLIVRKTHKFSFFFVQHAPRPYYYLFGSKISSLGDKK
jgi:hypothetical protein